MADIPGASDEAISNLYDSLEVGITLHEPETGAIQYANEYAEQIYGYSQSELSTMTVADMISTASSNSEPAQRLQDAANGDPQHVKWRIDKPSGEISWVEIRLSDLTVGEQSYVVAVIQDISESKMDKRHLRLLMRITRHNFRNQLNILKGTFVQIDKRIGESEILDRMRRSISSLMNLTSWINTVNSLNRGEKNTKKVNLCNLLENRVDEYRTNYPEINWEFDCETCYIDADSTIQKAFDELIDNAVRHNSHDDLSIHINVSENPIDQQIDVRVIDTGEPIPDIEIKPLRDGYEPDPLQHGENIGLWEVQTIINSHRGGLSIEENHTDRKAIEVTLPLADPM